MANITSLGIGSGIDLNSIVNQLVSLERKPLEQMQAQARTIQTRLSSMGQVQGLFSKLQDAANRLTGPALWNSVQATTTDAAAVSVRAAGGTPAGSYQVSVQQLARAQGAVSASVPAASAPVGAGAMSIEIGTWTAGNTSFTARAGGNPVQITITADDTLATLRDKINAADAGVTASVVTDTGGARLSIRSRETGLDSGFRIAVTDADGAPGDGAGLSRFAFDPPTGGGLTAVQAAANARATVNGVDVESTTNTVTGAVEGLSLTLGRVTTTPVDIGVRPDDEAVTKAVTDFAAAYSELARFLGEQTRFDPSTRVGGPLQGDSAANGLQSRLRGLVNTPSGASGVFSRLADLGLQLQRDGSMSVDAARLETAVARRDELRRALATSDTAQPGNAGLARRFSEMATAVLGADGTVTNRQAGLRRELTANQTRQERVNERAERMEKRLIEQYGALDRNASRLNGLSSFVSAQLAALNRNGNGGG